MKARMERMDDMHKKNNRAKRYGQRSVSKGKSRRGAGAVNE